MGGWIDGGGGGSIYFPLIGLYDTDSSNLLKLDWNENDSADRNLTFKVGGADREITLSGSPTLGDWFDQSVKAAASPAFAGLTLTAFSGVLKATTGVVAGGATKADIGLTNVEDTALSTWAGTTNITTLGTIATGAWHGTVIDADHGGTGQTVYAVGDLLYAPTTTTIGKLADVAVGSVLVSGGVGAAPAYSTQPQLTTVTFGTMYANGNSGDSKTIDWNNGQKQSLTITGAPCVLAFTAPPGAGNFLLVLTQGAGGSKTITWPGTVKWPSNGSAPTLSTTAAEIDIISFFYDGTNYYGSYSLDFA